MKRIRGYSSPFNLGHRALTMLFDDPVTVQEKIDGSQISFGLVDGELTCRSRNAEINLEDPQMFKLAIDTALDLAMQNLLVEGYTYRGEFLMKPKHNTLVYDRVPRGNIILFDIDQGDQDYMGRNELYDECDKLDLEVVPTWIWVTRPTVEELENWLQFKSILGNVLIEGLVFKNYSKYDQGAKVLMGKYVSEKFREVHKSDWNKRNPSRKDFISNVIAEYSTEARWEKARQHLEEAGELEHEPRDIPKLMKEVGQDVFAECGDEIKEKLFKHFWKQIQRGITKQLPYWYKEQLMKDALE